MPTPAAATVVPASAESVVAVVERSLLRQARVLHDTGAVAGGAEGEGVGLDRPRERRDRRCQGGQAVEGVVGVGCLGPVRLSEALAVADFVVAVGGDAIGRVRDRGEAVHGIEGLARDQAQRRDRGRELRTVPLWVVIVAEGPPREGGSDEAKRHAGRALAPCSCPVSRAPLPGVLARGEGGLGGRGVWVWSDILAW
jgi:hypothetical protein